MAKGIMSKIGDAMESVFTKKKEDESTNTNYNDTRNTIRLDLTYKDYATKAMENGETPLSKEEWLKNKYK